MIKLKCKIFHNPGAKGIRGQGSMEFYRSTPHGASVFAVSSDVIRDSSDSNPRFYIVTCTCHNIKAGVRVACHNIKAGVRVRGISDYIRWTPHIFSRLKIYVNLGVLRNYSSSHPQRIVNLSKLCLYQMNHRHRQQCPKR